MNRVASNRSAEAAEKRVAVVTIVVPFLATAGLMVGLWGRPFALLELGTCAVMYCLTMLGITLGYHRLFTHRSFKSASGIKFLLGILGCMAAQGPILFWTACHRHHHRCSDTEGDPHSPHAFGHGFKAILRGWWHAHTGWMLSHKPENYRRYVPDLVGDPLLRQIDRWYFVWIAVGLFVPAGAASCLARSWREFLPCLLWGGLVRIFLVHHSTWSVNSICHLFGSAPFDTPDESRNNLLCALLTFGEGWHNNHHAFPNSARHGLRWWQCDLVYLVLRSLAFCRLAWDVREPDQAEIIRRYRRSSTPQEGGQLEVPAELCEQNQFATSDQQHIGSA